MKLRKKIFLSATALAACAATLTTTTYAWYVTNSTATINGVSGAVSASGEDGNLLVAADNAGTPLAFSDKIDLSAYIVSPKKGLNPVCYLSENIYKKATGTYNAADTYFTYDSENKKYTEVAAESKAESAFANYYVVDKTKGWYDVEGASTTPDKITFRFWIKSTADRTITPSLTLKNTTSVDIKSQKLNNIAGAPTGVEIYGEFRENALNALRFGIASVAQQSESGEGEGAKTSAQNTETALAAATMKVYNPAKSNGVADSHIAITAPVSGEKAFAYKTDGDANQYYAAILHKAPFGVASSSETKTATAKKTIEVGTSKAEVERLIAKGIYSDNSLTEAKQIKDTTSMTFDNDSEGTPLLKTAVDYYMVESTNVTVTSATEVATPWNAFDLDADKPVLFEFTVWLEGSDAQCFDTCKGQTFDMAFSFGSQKKSA